MSHADERLHERARAVTPGGVHSPVRAFGHVGGTPIYMRRAAGSRIEAVDGRQYIDFCMAFGPLILGHAPPAVHTAVEAALARGWSYGTAEPCAVALAERVCTRLPFVEQIRFVSSGTEAVMTAVRVARAATGRAKVLKFAGCYHGHADAMLVAAGSGLAGAAVADSAGLPAGVVADTLVAPLDDEAALDAVFDAHGAGIAAAIIEPLPANHGLLVQRQAFLEALAAHCRRHGALLIFDEVISGFRSAFGGMAECTGIHPDLTTYGKVIGGGFPVGAYGGRRTLMALVAPEGPVYQAGTLAANPVTMAAGLATLEALADGTAYALLEARGRRLDRALAGHPRLALQRHGSLFWLWPRDAGPAAGSPRCPAQLAPDLAARWSPVYRHLLARGLYLPPSPYEVCFLSTAHDERDIDALAEALAEAPVTRS